MQVAGDEHGGEPDVVAAERAAPPAVTDEPSRAQLLHSRRVLPRSRRPLVHHALAPRPRRLHRHVAWGRPLLRRMLLPGLQGPPHSYARPLACEVGVDAECIIAGTRCIRMPHPTSP